MKRNGRERSPLMLAGFASSSARFLCRPGMAWLEVKTLLSSSRNGMGR